MGILHDVGLIILGALVALVSTLVSLWVKHRHEMHKLRRTEAQEQAQAEEFEALWKQLNANLTKDPIHQVSRLSEAMLQCIGAGDLTTKIPPDKAVELYLSCRTHLLDWSHFQQERLAAESRRKTTAKNASHNMPT